MKNIKSVFILFTMLINFATVDAQQKTVIRGRIVDTEDKMPVIGATVCEYDDEDRVVNGAISNVDGDFVYEMQNAGNTVRVSVIGYQTKEIEVVPNTSVIVELTSAYIALEDVQIVAEDRSNRSLTNIADRDKATSSVKVSLDELMDGGVSSAADALQGQVSGLDIMMTSGDPGSGSQIVIRGLSSMGSSQPLIVIDGIPQNRVSSGFDLSSADSEDISNLINIPLQDIKSIEVLKDAASTAIYGSRGADGVLLIETQQGKMGGVKFDYQYKYYIDIQPPPLPMLNGNEYIMLQLEEWHNSMGVFQIPPEIAYDRDYFDFYNYSQNTDWIEAITQNGTQQEHYFSISGGAKKTRYFTSFNYQDQTGTTINTGFSRFSTRTKLDYFLSRNLLFQVNFNYSSGVREGNLEMARPNSNRKTNVREMAYWKAPNMSIWQYDENGNPTGDYFTPIQSYQGDGVYYFNPVAISELGRSDQEFNNFENSFMLRYRLNDWLMLRETVSFQFGGQKSNEFLPSYAIGADWIANEINSATEQNNTNLDIRTESQLAFSSPFKSKNHEISGALTWVTEQSSYKRLLIEGIKTPSGDIQDPAINALIGRTQNRSQEVRLISSVNSFNYKAFDRYLLQGVVTLDAHSSFGSNNRWGLFYGVSAGWRFSNEPFFESLRGWLGESKLYVNYGVVGNQPRDPYARFATYETTDISRYINAPAIEPNNIELNNLRWSKVSSYDIGIELNLFADRVYLQADYYSKLTSDILFDRYNIPYSSGFTQLRYFNGGMVTNEGWELMGSYRVLRTENWLWSLNLNTSQNINTFNELPENFNKERSTSITNGEYPRRVKEGEPIGSFFGFRYLGVWPSDSDVRARDVNGNIIVDSYGNPIPLTYNGSYVFKGGDPIYEDVNHDGNIDLNDVVYIGNSNPDFIGGFGTNVRYKNFDFRLAFHYRLGFDIVNGVAIQTQGMNDRNNQSKAVLHRWRTQGQNEEGMLPRAYLNHPASNLGSDRYVEKGDYLRLNDIKIAYRLERKTCEKLGLSKASIAISARRLLTFTNYTGQDPAVSQKSDPFWMGVDNAETPPPKTINVSVNIGF